MKNDQRTVPGTIDRRLDGGSMTTWNCGFDFSAVVTALRLTGKKGVVDIDNFLGEDADGSAAYRYRSSGWGTPAETVGVPSSKPGAVLMFEDFSVIVQDNELRENSIAVTERAQGPLDAIRKAGLEHEVSVKGVRS